MRLVSDSFLKDLKEIKLPTSKYIFLLQEFLFSIYLARLVVIRMGYGETPGLLYRFQYPYDVILNYLGRVRQGGTDPDIHYKFLILLTALIIFVCFRALRTIQVFKNANNYIIGLAILTGLPLLLLRLHMTGYSERVVPLLTIELTIMVGVGCLYLYRSETTNIVLVLGAIATILHFSIWSDFGSINQLLSIAAMISWGYCVKVSGSAAQRDKF